VPWRALAELAEHSNAYTPLGPGEQRLEDPRFIVYLGRSRNPWSTVVQRLRLEDDDVEPTLADVRRLLERFGRSACQWEVSSSATPPELGDRLIELGLTPASEPLAAALVLEAPPPPAPPGLTVRLVETAADFLASQEIAWEAFDAPAEARERGRAAAAADFAAHLKTPSARLYLAEDGGRPIASARATFADGGVVLNAGGTLPDARGRGAYRALVAARWRDAVERGTPGLAVQAGAASLPILERLGFVRVAEIRILDDPG